MPRPRLLRSAVPFASYVALLAIAGACNSSSTAETPAAPSPPAAPAPSGSVADTASANSDPSASGSATASGGSSDDTWKPLHPGHLNQRDPKGGFMAALTAPPPGPEPAAYKPEAFDVPEEVNAPAPKPGDGHCGELDLGGGDKVVLDCMGDDYSMVAGAAKPTANSQEMASFHGRKLPAVVDHRKDGTEGPIMSQGKSPACTAFSLTAAADHAAAHSLGHPASLSPMHAWARYHSPRMSLAESVNLGKGLTDMATFPFDAKLANEWTKGEKRVDMGVLHRADASSIVEITNITRLDYTNMGEIKSALAAGQDVWFAIKGAHALSKSKKGADGETIVPDWDFRKAGSKGGHAILLAGYQDNAKGTFYLIHNSWGTKWGTEGYGWIYEKTLARNISDAYVVQVRPTEGSHTRRAPATHKYSTCRGSLAPDAITTQCVPACSDGGPRVNGVCPTAGQCPDGEVNLDGKCELSAPALSKTLSNGVKVHCGLSGCTYVVPTGQESCTSDRGCTISCAAPRFMLSSGPRGLACNG